MQEFIVKNLITVVFFLFLIYGFIKGFASGFIKKVLSLASIIITIFATRALTPMAASFIKDVTNLESSLTTIIYDALIKSNAYNSIDIPWLNTYIDTSNIEATIRDGLCTNLANTIINLICGIVIFIIVLILIKLIIKILDIVDYIPLVSQLNKILGGVLGVIEVMLIIYIAFTILRFFEAIPQVNVAVANIRASAFVGSLYDNNLIYNFFTNAFSAIKQ